MAWRGSEATGDDIGDKKVTAAHAAAGSIMRLCGSVGNMVNCTRNPPTPCVWQAPASTQHPENQKENQAGHSPERAAEGQGKNATPSTLYPDLPEKNHLESGLDQRDRATATATLGDRPGPGNGEEMPCSSDSPCVRTASMMNLRTTNVDGLILEPATSAALRSRLCEALCEAQLIQEHLK